MANSAAVVVAKPPRVRRHLPRAAAVRRFRLALRLRPRDPGIVFDGSDAIIRFALPRGSYATTVLREMITTTGDVTEES